MITKRVQLISTSNVDDAAFLALKDVCDLTADENIRVVGGQMIEMLRVAFPMGVTAPRSTIDADAAIETQFAASGSMHQLLTKAGYEATHGNSYVKGRQKIDLLVGNMLGKFKLEIYGERAFDSAPGIQLALDAAPIEMHANALLRDGREIEFSARIPTVEIALCIKSIAYLSRLGQQDLADAYYLLKIVDIHGPEAVGGWKLDQPSRGTRADAQRALGSVRKHLASNQAISEDIDRADLASLISKWVATP